MTDTVSTAYIPGVCNINRAEVIYRRKAANIAAALAASLLIGLVASGANRYIRLLIVLPVFIAAVNYLQVKNKFCVMYGAAGQQNADEGSAAASDVGSDANKAADKRKARRMNLQALGIAIVITLLALTIPHI